MGDTYITNNRAARFRDEGMLVVTITYARTPGGRPSQRTYTSYGDWSIEGNFIITYDENGRKTAHLLPDNTRFISERKSDALG